MYHFSLQEEDCRPSGAKCCFPCARSEPQFQNIEIKHLQKTRSLADVLTSLSYRFKYIIQFTMERKCSRHSNKRTCTYDWVTPAIMWSTYELRRESSRQPAPKNWRLPWESNPLKRSITRATERWLQKECRELVESFPTTPIRVVSPNINKTHLIETD